MGRFADAVWSGVGCAIEAHTLADGLVVHPERMRGNIDLTNVLLFADAAAARLGVRLGREKAHRLVEQVAEEVRRTGDASTDLLVRMPEVRDAEVDLVGVFDLGPAIAAAEHWVDPALHHAAGIRARLSAGDDLR